MIRVEIICDGVAGNSLCESANGKPGPMAGGWGSKRTYRKACSRALAMGWKYRATREADKSNDWFCPSCIALGRLTDKLASRPTEADILQNGAKQ